MRRLPIYILIDTSGSMSGEPIKQINEGLREICNALVNDPYAAETAFVSIIRFDRTPVEICPLISICDLKIPEIICPVSGPSHMGAALEFMLQKIKRNLIGTTAEKKGDWKPLVLIITNGRPSDTAVFRAIIPAVKNAKFKRLMILAIGKKINRRLLEELAGENVFGINDGEVSSFARSFFRWDSDFTTGSSVILRMPLGPAESKVCV